jgi:Cu2+-exporting ATPase
MPNPVPGKLLSFLYPPVVNFVLAVFRAFPYIVRGGAMAARGRFTLEALDAAALLVCLARRDFKTLSALTFFFAFGEFLADWTRKKSRCSLEKSLTLQLNAVWVRRESGEIRISYNDVREGDLVVARQGAAIPVDGVVEEGEGFVNQSSMTGESLPVARGPGKSVYAGTVLEEGELVIRAARVGRGTRIHALALAIEESESLKAAVQGRYERMADAIVPYNFLLGGLVYAVSRDVRRAGSVFLVDYSCALRLTAPLAIFTAMREAADKGVLIKGGKFMETLAEADVVVFDKTGTLTKASPTVVDVLPFGGRGSDHILRLAACLEEHFAHPVGQAVVRASEKKGLRHAEEHTRVDLVVAHGIASTWQGKKLCLGSEHFICDDESIVLTDEQRGIIDRESAKGRSVLYLSMDDELAGLLLIEDTLREGAADVIRALRVDGLRRVIMLTGDGEKSAAAIAGQLDIAEYKARMLPEDKAAFIRDLKRQGHTVAMIGDGINDSLALSAADVGISMAEGADIAREVADVVLLNGDLAALLSARAFSREALRRIRTGFRNSVGWNSLFLAGGLLGLLGPGLSALLHNATTAAIAVSSMRPFTGGGEVGEQGEGA